MKLVHCSFRRYFGAFIIAVLALSTLRGQAQTPPPLPFWQLSTWSFEDTSWYSDLGYTPLSFTNLNNPPSFDGNAVQVDTNVPAWLQYNIVESDSTTNITFEEGSIEMWVLPDWNSGIGPGDWGRLIDVGAYSTNDLSSWWSLYFSPDGTSLNFSSGTDGDITDYINYPISWDTNTWHFIALTYRFYKTELYIDGQLVTNGPGVWYEPSEQAQTNGFYVGSDATGTKQARGLIDDIATYNYALNATDVANDYAAMLPLLGFGGGFHTFDDPTLPGGGGGGGGSTVYGSSSTNYIFDTNQLWLQITNVFDGMVYANLFNGTNQVYAIWSTTNLLTPFTNWQVETEVFPTDTNCQPFNFPTLNRQNLFMLAQDWTGVDSDGDGIPDWWTWNYFGVLSLNATNLDSGGVNTLGYDYTNGLDPNTISFNMSFTSQYVDANSTPAQLNVTAGAPYYFAVLVDGSNYADANWMAYSSSNISVNLGSTEGWHQVYVGLRGFLPNASQTWESTRIKLDLTPPLLVITNPAPGTVTQPVIQLNGYSPEALASLSYDVSNANGLLTNQLGIILNQFYDTNSLEFTTNCFQCFDILLTNGVNTLTLHATDLAGNVTTTNFNFTLDYSGDTNPPAVQISWPQAGTKISGSSFTLRGKVSDPTMQVAAQIVDTNWVTNSVSGQVGRDGDFWVVGLPLSGGTNNLSLTVTDAAGNVSITTIPVIQSSLVITITSAGLGQAVNGTISDPTNYTIWVNGIKATNNLDGTWTAPDPHLTLDAPTVQVRAIPNSDNGGNGGGL